MSKAIGIDLDTSNSAAAFIEGGKPLPDDGTKRLSMQSLRRPSSRPVGPAKIQKNSLG